MTQNKFNYSDCTKSGNVKVLSVKLDFNAITLATLKAVYESSTTLTSAVLVTEFFTLGTAVQRLPNWSRNLEGDLMSNCILK